MGIARRSSVVLMMCLASGAASAQVFTVIDSIPAVGPILAAAPGPRPTAGTPVFSDHPRLVAMLAGAPMQDLSRPLGEYGLRLRIPGPTGAEVECVVAESPMMEAGLAARFPQIRTYIVAAVDGSATGRLEVSPRGMTGMLRTTSGEAWMIDPAWSADPTVLVSYHMRDLPGGTDWVCDTRVHEHDHAESEPAGFDPRGTPVQERRTVRVAMACTGEYGLHHSTIQGNSPNTADPLAAIVTVIGRTNVVYEADIGVHFDLVADNHLVVFSNPDTDPYPTTCDGLGGSDCSGPLLGANQGVLFNTFQSNGGYDLGHIVTRIAGGVAYLRDVCGGGGGVSGIPRGGDVDPFSALVVIHEFGHQFGANHTFSGTRGRCGNNARLASAWEAGSGSSPMAYAGGCPVGDAPPSDNIVQFADPFFHHGSIEEMKAFLPDATCMGTVATGNHIPEFTQITPNRAIPPGTPFTLTAVASDPDAGSVLTYSWEQFDNGVRRPLEGEGSEDNGDGSLFRIFPPTTAGSRTFPKLADVRSGVPTPGEKLPTVTGVTRDFRAVVRDNDAGLAGASVISPVVSLTIAGTGPFAVTAPTQGQSIASGSRVVRWSRGGTQNAPISTSQVQISLSLDDGLTFPFALGQFANSGQATVTLPNRSSNVARIRIDPVGNIYFAMSRPFTLVNSCPADFNADGFLDFFDYDAFVTAFETGEGPSADFNGDDFVDFFDYDAYVAAFEAGC
ncbi:MAG: hypothetical protein HEQ23_07615 [Tepidisphaera sp.]